METASECFATASVGKRVFLGKLEILEGNSSKGPFFYWHFSTPDFLGNQEETIKMSSCYRHIKTKEELENSLQRFGIKQHDNA